MTLPGREYTDESLLMQLASFLAYEAKGGGLCFAAWADTKDFAPSDRDFLEVAYMGTQMPPGMAS